MRENSRILLTAMALRRFTELPKHDITYWIDNLYLNAPKDYLEISRYITALAKESHLPSGFFFWLEANYLNLELAMKGGDDDE